ncbi:hypothetical protein F4777DRAFT_524997 [Nemania sp. FL0916]|nr:hypothetical protein F4777DRAFT_524997 [Nemania sp. FL0916]
MGTNEGVEVKKSLIPGAGNGLFARKAFSPGDVVASVDRPLVAELEVEHMLDTCAWCFQRGATDPTERKVAASMGLPHGFTEVKACTGCQRVAYCSRPCQSKAWKREHKYECKAIGKKEEPDLPPGVRGAIKILGRLKADSKSEMVHVRNIQSIWPVGDPNGLNHIAAHDKKKFDDFQILGEAAWIYSGKPSIEGLDLHAISRGLLPNIMSNSYALSSQLDGINLGIGFDPLICSANHSCDPNAALVFNQPQHEIRALRAIKQGEEVFLKYVETTTPYNIRQAQMKEEYLFNCRCARCSSSTRLEGDQFLGRPEDLASEYCQLADKLASKHESKLSVFVESGGDVVAQRRVAALQAEAYAVLDDEQATVDGIKEAIRMCIGSKMWRWTRQPVPRLCRRLFTMYLGYGYVYQAFRLGMKLHFEILPALYPQEFYLDRLTNAWDVSTVINVLCGHGQEEVFNELARGGLEPRVMYFEFLFYVHDHAPRMFGPNTPFWKVIDNTYKQIIGGMGIPVAKIKEKTKALRPSMESLARSVNETNL